MKTNLISEKYLKLLACPLCKGKLKLEGKKLICAGCSHEYGFESGFPVLIPNMTEDIKLSMRKWDDLYQHKLRTNEYIADMEDYQVNHQTKIVEQIDSEYPLKRGDNYLEIGCGPAYLGLHYGKKGVNVIGIDFSPGALKMAKKLADDNKIQNAFFVLGDITQMPFADNTMDVVYGGGVIEHFKNTQKVVDENYRVLKKGGVSFNTVPCLNIGTIYRMRWGNCPNVPVIRQIFEYVNVDLLKGKHMTFGYELSFLRSTLSNLHKKAGFKKVKVDRFDTYLLLESVPGFAKGVFYNLCRTNELFWPMYKVIGKK